MTAREAIELAILGLEYLSDRYDSVGDSAASVDCDEARQSFERIRQRLMAGEGVPFTAEQEPPTGGNCDADASLPVADECSCPSYFRPRTIPGRHHLTTCPLYSQTIVQDRTFLPSDDASTSGGFVFDRATNTMMAGYNQATRDTLMAVASDYEHAAMVIRTLRDSE